jgi:hypothetical protein
MSVAPRWKRRADEIAEAIGDELSVNGTVSIGNDVSLSVATITALANAITSVLNSASIARAMWTSDIVGTHDARAVYTVDGGGYWSITAPGGVAGAGGSPAFIYQVDGTTAISARSGAEDRHEDVIFLNNVWQLPIAIVRNVNVLSTVQQPVHVELKNVTGGFTALGVNVSNAMKLSAQPISIADTVNVKTATGEAVAITGTVNANVGGITLPISNPNNITCPVVNTNSVTVPVNVGSATVPVRASANGTPQNSSGVNVLVPVNPTHSVTVPVSAGSTTVPVSVPSGLTVPASVPSGLTVPVAVGGATVPAYVPNTLTVPASVPSGLTVPVAVGSNTVPVAVGSVTVPVANTNSIVVPVENTNNVTIPVTSSGTVLNVKIVEISTVAPSGGVAPTEAFEAAMEDAINDAEELTGVIVGPNIHTTASVSYSPVWDILGSNGVTYTSQYLAADSPTTINPGSRHVLEPRSAEELRKYLGRRVRFNTNATAQYNSPSANGKEWFLLTDGVISSGVLHVTDPRIGYVFNSVNISGQYIWTVQDSAGDDITNQNILWENTWQTYSVANSAKFRGATVHHRGGTEWLVVALAT